MNKEKEQRLCFRKFIITAVVCFGLVSGIHVHSAVAVDTEDPADENETPSYANPAQAQHAANLATAAASQPDEDTEAALSAVEQAEADLAEAEQNGTQDEIDQALENLAEAQQAYADLIAEKTGVISKDIVGMRNSGMGWGQIANELGVHPGLLGLGHTKKGRGADADVEKKEIVEATSRNTRSGWSKGHGVGLNSGVKSTSKSKGGFAYGHAQKGTKGKGSQGGISGASGLSSGKGGANSGSQGGGSGGNGKGSAGRDGSPGNSGNNDGKGNGKGNNKGGGNGKGGGKGK